MFIRRVRVGQGRCETWVQRLVQTLTFFVNKWERPPFFPRHVKSTSSIPLDQSVIVKCHLELSESEEIFLLLHVHVCVSLLVYVCCVEVIYLSPAALQKVVFRGVFEWLWRTPLDTFAVMWHCHLVEWCQNALGGPYMTKRSKNSKR